ncbi:MAG: transporter [Planctomycetaceae bacterium]|nr:transporter [Planctomycetales bacterium]MCB9925169.1 transporter [Planctomycetaceae bacterium]
MFTLGGTYYLDEDKTWTASALCRYETNSQRTKVAIRPGDDFHIEWGIGKSLTDSLIVGASGYCHWQVTNGSGAAVAYDPNIHDQFFSAGPEVQCCFQPVRLCVQVRYQFEVATRDRPEGQSLVFSFVKILDPCKRQQRCKRFYCR